MKLKREDYFILLIVGLYFIGINLMEKRLVENITLVNDGITEEKVLVDLNERFAMIEGREELAKLIVDSKDNRVIGYGNQAKFNEIVQGKKEIINRLFYIPNREIQKDLIEYLVTEVHYFPRGFHQRVYDVFAIEEGKQKADKVAGLMKELDEKMSRAYLETNDKLELVQLLKTISQVLIPVTVLVSIGLLNCGKFGKFVSIFASFTFVCQILIYAETSIGLSCHIYELI